MKNKENMINQLYKTLYKKYFIHLLITIPLGIILGILSMYILSMINESISSGLTSQYYNFLEFFLIITGLLVVGFSVELIRVKLTVGVTFDIQTAMIKEVLNTPYHKLEKIGFPKVVATMTKDLDVGIELFHFVPDLIVNSFLIIAGLIYLYLLSPMLLLIILFILISGIVILGLIVAITGKKRKEIREDEDKVMKGYESIVKGKKELMLNHVREDAEYSILFLVIKRIRENSNYVFNRLALTEQLGQYILFLIIGLIVFVFSHMLELSNDVVVGYILVLLFLIEPIEMLFQSFDKVLEGKVAFDKVMSLGLGDNDDVNPSVSRDIENKTDILKSKLILDNVSYRYSEGGLSGFSLKSISATFQPGGVTFITGGNGSGKSTLIKIISGLYIPSKGDVIFSDMKITQENIYGYRKNISLVAQDYWLFQNIVRAEGGGECNEGLLEEYLKKLQLDSIVQIDDCRFSTINLSQGQRKRLALIQALLEQRQIILLDEWAADQDYGFKKIFYKEIIPELKSQGKIVIIISHDEQFFFVADQVLNLNRGELS